MEDQGKRLLLAVAIAFGIMLVWQVVFPSKKPKPEDKTKEGSAEVEAGQKDGGAKDGTAPDAPPSDKTAPSESAEPPDKSPAAERGAEVSFEVKGDLFEVAFTSYGGAVKSYRLLGDQYIDHDRNAPMDLVRTEESEGLPLSVHFANNSSHDVPTGAEWKGELVKSNEVKFSWESEQLRVEKFFTVYPDDFVIELVVEVTNLSTTDEVKQAPAVSLFGFEDPKATTERSMTKMPRAWAAGCLVDDEVKQYSAKKVIKRDRAKSDVRWGGFVHTYFLSALAVDPDADGPVECKISSLTRPGAMRLDLVYPLITLKPGDPPARRHLVGYFGPKYLQKLEAVGATTDFEHPGFEEAIDFGWFGVISRPLLWLLTLFQSFVINWGVAIILLTVVVKLATLYWTHKSMKSMRAMAKLKPKLDSLKEKHADDKEALNRETMNLFKAHGVNPLSGCLPMLLQMPIWFALYRMLMAVAELYQAPFIPGWIDDLTQPDPIYVLPVLLTGMMFVQSKLTPVTQSGLQQKLIQYGMPIMFGVFSFFFPAGLTLYIFTNVCLTACHHLVIHREGRAEAKATKLSKAKKMASKADAEAVRAKRADSEADDADSDETESEPENGKGAPSSKENASAEGARRAGKRSKKGSRSRGKRKRKRKR